VFELTRVYELAENAWLAVGDHYHSLGICDDSGQRYDHWVVYGRDKYQAMWELACTLSEKRIEIK